MVVIVVGVFVELGLVVLCCGLLVVCVFGFVCFVVYCVGCGVCGCFGVGMCFWLCWLGGGVLSFGCFYFVLVVYYYVYVLGWICGGGDCGVVVCF